MTTTYSFAQSKGLGSMIELRAREFDGIGRAEHSILDRIGIPEASRMVAELEAAIEAATAADAEAQVARRAELAKQAAQIESEIQLLDERIARTGSERREAMDARRSGRHLDIGE